jgi:hypothetical protein
MNGNRAVQVARRLCMTVGKAAALTAGFVGAVALGVALGPSITDRMSDIGSTDSNAAAAKTEEARPAPERERASRTKAGPATVAKVKADESGAEPVAVAPNPMRPDEPRVQQRLKPVLNRGAKMDLAAEGFLTAEEFATVAHAARNTNVPFMVLKHRVLNEKRPMEESMAAAIRELKPDLTAKAEVARAKREAREDLSDISN